MTALPRTILVVDDDLDDLLDITAAFQQADPTLHLTVAYNGEEALSYLRKAKAAGNLPRLITLDVNMPRMDGRQTLTALKADPQFSAIPVVLLTTSASMADRTFSDRYGVEMVTKPHNHRDIIGVVERILTRALTHS